jgi:carbon-monoxide dehydrogenase large subunit
VAYAALQLKRPVKWQAERLEDFTGRRAWPRRGQPRRDGAGRQRQGAGAARALAANVGAYATTTAVAIQLLIGPWVSTSIYDIPTIDFQFTAVLTNTTPTGAYRGAGRPEAIYITERLMDAAARELKMDPAELRRRNMIRPEQMPYTNPMGQVYDSGALRADPRPGPGAGRLARLRRAPRRRAKARGKLRGRGIATFLEWTGGNALRER